MWRSRRETCLTVSHQLTLLLLLLDDRHLHFSKASYRSFSPDSMQLEQMCQSMTHHQPHVGQCVKKVIFYAACRWSSWAALSRSQVTHQQGVEEGKDAGLHRHRNSQQPVQELVDAGVGVLVFVLLQVLQFTLIIITQPPDSLRLITPKSSNRDGLLICVSVKELSSSSCTAWEQSEGMERAAHMCVARHGA